MFTNLRRVQSYFGAVTSSTAYAEGEFLRSRGPGYDKLGHKVRGEPPCRCDAGDLAACAEAAHHSLCICDRLTCCLRAQVNCFRTNKQAKHKTRKRARLDHLNGLPSLHINAYIYICIYIYMYTRNQQTLAWNNRRLTDPTEGAGRTMTLGDGGGPRS